MDFWKNLWEVLERLLKRLFRRIFGEYFIKKFWRFPITIQKALAGSEERIFDDFFEVT